MKIVLSFIGGGRDGRVIAGDANDEDCDSMEVAMLYVRTHHGMVGKQFSMEASAGRDVYEVTERIERGNSVIVRARHVAHTTNPAELMSLLS